MAHREFEEDVFFEGEEEVQSPVEPRQRSERKRPLRCDILYDDARVCVVNKPAGMFTDGGLFDDASVFEQISSDPNAPDEHLSVIYPLDMDVSGVLVIARDDEAAAALQSQFDAGAMTVTFLAIVRGLVEGDDGTLSGTVSNPKSGRVKVVEHHGEPATTQWRLRDAFVGFALIECIPRTCAEQQIRAQLHDAGMPAAVDPLHGGAEYLNLSSFKSGYRPSRRHPERPLIQRTSLHATTVSFRHPSSDEALHFEAPLPKDFKATLHQLDRHGRIAKQA